MKSLLVGVMTACAAWAVAQSLEAKCLVSSGQAYVFGSPRQIAVGLGVQVEPSPDGRFVAFRRVMAFDPLDEIRGKALKPKFVFTVYDVLNDRLWDVAQSDASVQFGFTWSKNPGQGVLVEQRQVVVDGKEKVEATVSRLSLSQRQKSFATRYVVDSETLVDVAPDGQRILVSTPGVAGASEVYDLNTGRRVGLPEVAKGSYRMWAPDGTLLVSSREGNTFKVSALDLSTLQLVPYTRDRDIDRKPDPFYVFKKQLSDKEGGSNILVASSIQAFEDGDDAQQSTKQGRLEKLVKNDPTLLGPVALDADPSEQVVSEKGRFVVYAKRGGVYICPFEVVDEAWLEKMLMNRARTRAMNQSKQVALALIMYGSDFDDKYPPNADWQNLVDPYMRNRELAKGFTYALDGIDMSKLDDPAGTILGSVDTPWGRAVAYADGHVKWIPAVNPEANYWPLVAADRRRVDVG